MAEKTPEKIAIERIEKICSSNPSTILDLTNLNLTKLPIEITKAKHLKVLYLSDNYLEYLPDFIGSLEMLRELDLRNNEIRQLPNEISKLTQLTNLDLRRNQLETVPFGITELASLKVLDLRNNRIQELPLEIIKLINLRRLDLRRNLLRIPVEILENTMHPKGILSAYFGEDVIKGVEEKLEGRDLVAKISLFTELYPKREEIEKVFKEALEKVKNRLPISQAKILILGQGSVGKTSLVHRITDKAFDFSEIKTEGIAISQWAVEDQIFGDPYNIARGKFLVESLGIKIENTENAASSSLIDLNLWDFGGQEIMHATHQFFLTKRSLYLLVLDSRLTQEENRVEYWLKIIQSFGGESPVLLVGNKTDQHPLDIDRTGLQKKYPNIVGILETSAATGAGIEELKAAIAKQVNNLPHVRDLLPETWFTVKTKLEELGRQSNFITHDKYLELCAENEVSDETSQRTLIGFLHDLGVVLHFQDDPRLEALGILNPQWVTNGVYKILNSHTLFQNKGVLTTSMLDEILNLPEYPRGKRLFIVDMMKKFELCYDIEADKTFLVPDLLPKDEPAELKFNGIPAFEYAYPVLPSSVITRFIVRMNQKIDDGFVWRTGVVLKIGENKALVKADIEDRKITIAIDGVEHTRRDALSAIRFQLDEIHASIKGLNPEKRVPIPEAPNAEPLDYDYLLQLERDGFDELPVKAGNRLVKVNVKQLLSGVESESQRRENVTKVTNIYNVNTGGGDFTGRDKSVSAGDGGIAIGGSANENDISNLTGL
jgi:internalin A